MGAQSARLEGCSYWAYKEDLLLQHDHGWSAIFGAKNVSGQILSKSNLIQRHISQYIWACSKMH